MEKQESSYTEMLSNETLNSSYKMEDNEINPKIHWNPHRVSEKRNQVC